MDQSRLGYLLQCYFAKTYSSAEYDELMQYIATAKDDKKLEAELNSLYITYMHQVKDQNVSGEEILSRPQTDVMLQTILSAEQPPRQTRLWKFGTWQKVAAVLVIAAIGTVVWKKDVLVTPKQLERGTTSIKAGGNVAVLTLANGAKIDLKDAKNGDIINTNGIKITKTADGQLSYEVLSSADSDPGIGYNTITTPRGGQYQVKLPDGTQVWLNAASSLRYPVQFAANERRVVLTGEGYFEVAKNPQKPFVVEGTDQDITVLGTHFNINAYRDDVNAVTTVLEGSVKVAPKSGSSTKIPAQILKINQQSVFNTTNKAVQVHTVNAMASIAWKLGKFQFQKAPIREVMKQFSRWYDVAVRYEGNVPNIFLTGDIKRNVDAREALEILKFFDLKYRIEQHGKDQKTIVIDTYEP